MAVRIEKNGAVWTVIHDRPEARNAMDPASADALNAAFLEFDADDGAAVAVFYGAGGGHHVQTTRTQFVLHLFEAPLPGPRGFSATLSPLRRPAPETAPTDAKAACLYPNSDRATREAARRGFDAAVMRDPWDNIAEFAFANIFIARNGRVLTPAANGTFLAGITRRRVLALLNEAGIEAKEAKLTVADLHSADEIFSVGNYAKVMVCNRFEDRPLNAGPIAAEARRRYFAYAAQCRVA